MSSSLSPDENTLSASNKLFTPSVSGIRGESKLSPESFSDADSSIMLMSKKARVSDSPALVVDEDNCDSDRCIPTLLDLGDPDDAALHSREEEAVDCDNTDSSKSSASSATVQSSAERRRREEAESERLAWEMMRQESIAAYQVQLEYMRENSEQLSAEDLNAINLIMNEAGAVALVQEAAASEQQGEQQGQQQGEDEDEGEGDDQVDTWDYDRLLALGEVIGDVKTERWRQRAADVFMTLRKCLYSERKPTPSTSSLAVDEQPSAVVDTACSICMDMYQDDESLCELPCKHFFHETCAEGWIRDHNSCPMCKRKVTQSP